MTDKIINLWIRFRHGEDGATLVECGIALVLAVTLGAGALGTLASDVGGAMAAAGDALPAALTSGG